MSKEKLIKTNAMRILDKNKISYSVSNYDISDGNIDGVSVAEKVNRNKEEVFKTLVTTSTSRNLYVFLIPVAEELDLKKAAKAVGEKSVEMLKSKDLLPSTGYVHGGCSPIGMKKEYKTIINESAKDLKEIVFSAGKIGYQINIELLELEKVLEFTYVDVIK
ncbi:Cys-tRNA(Pro) deacylase [Clostridium tertium]|uniref:Cys-tRNA(Pro)/Cys-tRNA(Cys) deacylase n=1 Tax=Clostridium tertium TaxID=1559 RepID=A0A6N2YBY3_9CLOT